MTSAVPKCFMIGIQISIVNFIDFGGLNVRLVPVPN